MCVSINMKFPTCFDSMRVYEPPDPPGYFDGHVWPMYLKHRREIEGIEEIGKCPYSFYERPLTCHCQKVHKIQKECFLCMCYIIKETWSYSTLGSRLPQQVLLAYVFLWLLWMACWLLGGHLLNKYGLNVFNVQVLSRWYISREIRQIQSILSWANILLLKQILY